MMHMSFWWGANLGDVFIKGLAVNTTGGMIGLCIGLVILSVLYEGLKVHGVKTRAKAARERQRAASCAPSESANLLAADPQQSGSRIPFNKKFFILMRDCAIFLFHNILGYALMLIVMLYNGYVFIAVVLGMTLGYFLFGHIAMRVNMENLQAVKTKVVCSPQCPDADPFAGHNNSGASVSSSVIASTSTAMKRIQEGASTSSGGPVTVKSCQIEAV